jgi:hypothetical protein
MTTFKIFFLKFLLLPLIAFLLVGIMILVQKKNAAANNKKLIIYILLASIVLSLPGIGGLAGNTFNPYWYLFSQTIYLGLGILNVNLLGVYFRDEKNKQWFSVLQECLITIICMLLGAYLFTLLFDLFSPFDGFAWISATTIFIFSLPLVFYYAWLRFTNIPFDIYKVWVYDPTQKAIHFEEIDFDKLMVLNVEFTKKIEDGHRFSVKAKSPAGIKLGDWFYRFIEDYNLKYPANPVEVNNHEQQPYSWIFYIKSSFFHRRKYLDFDKTIAENKITEKVNIICKRVIEQYEEKVVATKNKFY